MKDTLDELLSKCIQIGITIEEFWDMDYSDIDKYFKAFTSNKEAQLKEKAYTDWRLAGTIGRFIASVLSDGNKPPTLYESYPEIFKEEAEEEKWKTYQAQMMAYSELWNNKRHEKEDLLNG